MEFTEGIEFSRGISTRTTRDRGPGPDRHPPRPWTTSARRTAPGCTKASKFAPRVAVYTHKTWRQVARNLAGERIHRTAALELYALDRY